MPQSQFHDDLIQYGFTIVYMEDLTVFNQVQLFKNCEIIIAVHGAAPY